MKVILSRKGFDSKYGARPSPILPDGRMISLPIPTSGPDKYSTLWLSKRHSYFDLMKTITPKIVTRDGKWEKITRNTTCHCDPDIFAKIKKRDIGWLPIFGQVDKAQGHLKKEHVKENDLFIFFGTFRNTIKDRGKILFDRKSHDRHIIFGYLQIGEILNVHKNREKIKKWMKNHPHVFNDYDSENNTIYIARKKLSWNNKLPGSGTFIYDNSLVLTAKGQNKSVWKLPKFFKKVKISRHDKSSWRGSLFQSVGLGQEIVIEDDIRVGNWAKKLIENNVKNK